MHVHISWLYEECSEFNLVQVIKDQGTARVTIDYIKKNYSPWCLIIQLDIILFYNIKFSWCAWPCKLFNHVIRNSLLDKKEEG